MDELVAFLRARLDEREQAAMAMAAIYPEPWEIADRGWMVRVVADGPHFPAVTVLNQEQMPEGFTGFLSDVLQHLMLNGPASALADVESKRQVIQLYENAVSAMRAGSVSYRNRTQDEAAVDVLGAAVKSLALPYAGRPDYRQEWKP